jgi:hypothetical protein
MFAKKRTIVAFGLALAALSAHAMPIVEDNTFKVFIPNSQPGFDFYAGAVWLRPAAGNLNYVIYNEELPAQSPAWNERELRPQYDPGFELGMRFVFPCSGQDIDLNWTSLDSSTSATTNAPNADFFLGPDYEIGPPGLEIRHVHGHVRFQYDVFNVTAGQHVNFGPRVAMRFFGGASGAYLREDVISNFSGTRLTTFPGPWKLKQDITANFAGWGPRVGMKGSYLGDWGFTFFGEGAISALIGSTYSKANFTASSPELLTKFGQEINHQLIKDQRVMQVIPAIDAKVGISWAYQFSNYSILTAAAGWEGAVYINAVSQYLPESLVDGTGIQDGGIFVATMSHRLSNYSVQGPFIKIGFQL